MWLVPTYANPIGFGRVAGDRRPAGLDADRGARTSRSSGTTPTRFHHLTEDEAKSADILTLAAAVGPPAPADHVRVDLEDHPGGRRASRSSPASVETVKWYTGHLGKGAIGPDKVNQLRHAQFFGSPQGVRDHMVKHREIIAPKFAEVERILTERLGGPRRRDLDQADRRLLRQPRRPRRHRLAGGPARQGRRHRPHAGRRVVPPRRRPARPQHPPRPDLPPAGPGQRGDGGRGHLRPARRRREGARRLPPDGPVCRRARPCGCRVRSRRVEP